MFTNFRSRLSLDPRIRTALNVRLLKKRTLTDQNRPMVMRDVRKNPRILVYGRILGKPIVQLVSRKTAEGAPFPLSLAHSFMPGRVSLTRVISSHSEPVYSSVCLHSPHFVLSIPSISTVVIYTRRSDRKMRFQFLRSFRGPSVGGCLKMNLVYVSLSPLVVGWHRKS